MERRTIGLLAPLVAFLLGARQEPAAQEPPKKGLHVQTAGIGWLPLVEVPNAIPLTRDDPEGKRYISRLDAWTPLTITFDNRGEALSGTLTVRPTWPEDPNPVVYHKRIRIGGNGISRVSIPILNNSVWPYRFTFDDDKQGAVAIGGAREFEVGRPRTQGVTTRIVLVVTSARTNFLHFLRRNSAAQLLTDRMLLPIESRQMPQTGLEFQPVDTVIFDDIPLEELSPAQQTALHEWVCRGGTMITCLNRNASRAIPPMLEGLVPGTPGPIQNRSDFEELRNATGVACRQDPSVAALTFAPKPGATGWADASPVIVHRPVDLGMTLAVGFPISARFLQTWHGSTRLMDSLIEFDRRAQVPFSGTASLNDLRAQLARALKGSIAKTLPPFRTVMLLMLVYGALVILLPYAGFRPFRRLEYAWALVFVLAIAGAGVVYGVGAQYLTKNSSAWRVTIVEGGAPGPHTRHNFWVAFTAKSDRVDLTFDRPSVGYPLGTELALRGEAGAAEAMNLWYEPEGHVRGLRTFAQDSVLFETTDSEPVAGSLEFRAEPSESAVRVRLDVRDGFALRKAWMAWGARVAEIVPGAAEVSWAGSDVAAVEGSAARRSVFEALATEALRQARSTGRPVLLYETHGEAGLEKPALNEEHWHFGFLQPMAPEIPARASDWTVRRLTPVPTGDEAVDIDAPVEYVLSLVTPDRIASVEVPDWRDDRVTVEFLNVRTQVWDEIKRGYAIRADPYVTYGRLGRAFIRARLSGRGVGIRTEFPRLTWK